MKAALVLATTATMALVLNGATPAFASLPMSARIVSRTVQDPDHERCLDVEMESAGNVRTNVQLYGCRGNREPLVYYQVFGLESIGGQPRNFKIWNWQTGKCLTYPVGGGVGAHVWAEKCDRDGQGWYRVETTTGATKLVAVETNGMCLDAVDPNGGIRTGIDLWDCSVVGDWMLWDVR
jgi:hypothetical protein